MCSRPNCKCHSKESFPVPKSQTWIQVVHWHIFESKPTNISLNLQYGSYLHHAETNSWCYDKQNNQLVYKLYMGPCGFLVVFGALDAFEASSVTFACGSDPQHWFANTMSPIQQTNSCSSSVYHFKYALHVTVGWRHHTNAHCAEQSMFMPETAHVRAKSSTGQYIG